MMKNNKTKTRPTIEEIEQTIDKKLTAAEMYANRPRKWLLYMLVALCIALLVGWSSKDIRFTGLTATGTEVAKGVLHGVFGPDFNLMFGGSDTDVPYLLLQTVAIAVLGTLIGAILAIPFAFLASFNIMPKPVAYVVRIIILMIRTIPSIVWALMWIRVTGPGAACGVITQSVCSIGMISKMYITAIEDLDTHILESLDAMGCTPFQKIRYGVIPQLTASFISTTIYRFDINLKDATTLGIVGAGGIGASLVQCLNSRRWAMVGSFVWGLMVLVLLIEFVSTRIRRKLAHGA
jgi:phosphonate transport system permease protein